MKTIMVGFVLFCSFLFAGQALAAIEIGKIVEAQGTGQVTSTNGDTRAISKDLPVYLGDRIHTEAAARLLVHFSDGSEISQGERSDLVLDSYVYDPQKREDNNFLVKLANGIFRIITDQITKLNPDRFEVKTSYGTIGIRGCDLGFSLQDAQCDVYVIELHTADSVVIKPTLAKYPALTALEVRKGGRLVSLSLANGMAESAITAAQMRYLQSGTLPATSKPTTGRQDAKASGGGTGDPSDRSSALSQSTIIAPKTPDANAVPKIKTTSVPPTVTPNSNKITSEPAKPSNPAPVPTVPTPTSPILTYPIVGPSISVASGSGTDWSWGIWEQKQVDLVNGQRVTSYNVSEKVGGNFISQNDFQALAAGGILYNLTGTGPAGASVTLGNQIATLNGTLDLNVQLGLGILPTWQGDVNVSDVANSLVFSVPGTFLPNGQMTGTPTAYQLNAFGQTYGLETLQEQKVHGNLTGSGTGATPITGAVLDFKFGHGYNGPSVSGAGGANLH